MLIDLVLLSALLFASIWTVMTIRLLRSVIGLALTSAILSVIMFRLNSSMAAVFELSVCSGLISVIFVTTVSFTQRVSKERLRIRRQERFAKFWLLPVIIVIMAIIFFKFSKPIAFEFNTLPGNKDVREVIWNLRHLDLLGQIIAILAGVFGVAMLFKENKR